MREERPRMAKPSSPACYKRLLPADVGKLTNPEESEKESVKTLLRFCPAAPRQ
jgi:hypothetical protein